MCFLFVDVGLDLAAPAFFSSLLQGIGASVYVDPEVSEKRDKRP